MQMKSELLLDRDVSKIEKLGLNGYKLNLLTWEFVSDLVEELTATVGWENFLRVLAE